jgi:V/A-type H+-transporting ATPase subunit K
MDKTGGRKMNKNTLKMSLRTLIVLLTLALVAQGAAAADGDTATDSDATDGMTGDIGVGLALGLAAIGAGFSQAAIGSAAVGMLAEDGSKFGVALIFTALPESIVILGALPLFLGN